MAEKAFDKTYEMAPDPPPPMDWEEYEERVLDEWETLLAARPAEADVQKFLEQHPSMLPGHRQLFGMIGHQGPLLPTLISQPPLQALGTKIPDFMWIAVDTAHVSPVLIEIEDPSKPWLTKQGLPSQKLMQALDQLRQWRDWLSRPENQLVFLSHYDIPNMLRRERFAPSFLLIYGRRSENAEKIGRLRAHFGSAHDRQLLITFDHLRPSRAARDYLCVTKRGERYQALSVPPTLRLGPRWARELREIDGKEAAAARSPWLTDDRHSFLAERFGYWDNWDATGVQQSGDVE